MLSISTAVTLTASWSPGAEGGLTVEVIVAPKH